MIGISLLLPGFWENNFLLKGVLKSSCFDRKYFIWFPERVMIQLYKVAKSNRMYSSYNQFTTVLSNHTLIVTSVLTNECY